MIDLLVNNRVAVPPHIDSNSIIHGVTDNFDHNDTDDSILMLFQNSHHNVKDKQLISSRPGSTSTREQKLPFALPCQSLIGVQKGQKRGSVPPNFAFNSSHMKNSTESMKMTCLVFFKICIQRSLFEIFAVFQCSKEHIRDKMVNKDWVLSHL